MTLRATNDRLSELPWYGLRIRSHSLTRPMFDEWHFPVNLSTWEKALSHAESKTRIFDCLIFLTLKLLFFIYRIDYFNISN
jgi:hypothetical protein